jgi:hypothetical protein
MILEAKPSFQSDWLCCRRTKTQVLLTHVESTSSESGGSFEKISD